MHLLLTNDDGVDAPGLQALVEVLAPEHHLTIVAPHRQRSASGMAITLHKPLRVERRPGRKGLRVFACSGTPADCAAVGLYALCEEPVDLVVSGINDGPNMGEDVLHSGTVGAALEARMMGYPAMALSVLRPPDGSPTRFDAAAEVARRLVASWGQGWSLDRHSILNINVPAQAFDELTGAAIVTLGTRAYWGDVRVERGDDGWDYYLVYGEARDVGNHADTDVEATRAGKVAITPVSYRMSSLVCIEGLQASPLAEIVGGQTAWSREA